MGIQKKKLISSIEDASVQINLDKGEIDALIRVLEKLKEQTKASALRDENTIKRVAFLVCSYLGLPVDALYQKDKGKQKVYCMSLIAYILNRYYQFHPTHIATHFGMHRTTMIYLIKKYEKLLEGGNHSEVFNMIWKTIRDDRKKREMDNS
jgi:chromosomal replication initiation ATPase DnaA